MRTSPDRLAVLRRLLVLDSTPERAYDDIANLLATSLDVPITMINLLDEKRDWFKACVGFAVRESPESTSFCEAFFHTDADLIVVPDTTSDDRFSAHPLVTGEPLIRFYASARLTIDGQTVGTLCAYDTEPRAVTEAQIELIRSLAGAAVELLGHRPLLVIE